MTLQLAYRKYKAYLEAQRKLESKVNKGTWVGKKPTNTDLVELFVGKSMFYQYYKKGFGNINDFPIMMEWLEGGEGAPSDLDVWGVERTTYTFADLFKYFEDEEDAKGKKGKKKKGGDDDGQKKQHKKAKK